MSFRCKSAQMINCTSLLRPPGGGGVVWSKLQAVLSSVEDSISCKRSWAAPITAADQHTHREHVWAAQESWGRATQVSPLPELSGFIDFLNILNFTF